MKNIKDALENMGGEQVDIYTKHYLFDGQHIESQSFLPITDIGVGFKYKNQKIYIKYDEIESYNVKADRIIINGKGFIIMIVKRY